MKSTLKYAIAACAFFTACSTETAPFEPEFPADHALQAVCFSLGMENEVLAFPATRAMPELNIGEPQSQRTGDDETGQVKELNDLCTRIDYFVFLTGEEPQLYKQQQFIYDPTDLDQEFGIIYDSLPKGNYQICFLAHSSETVNRENSLCYFDRVTDTFWQKLALTIEPASEINESVELQRIVSRIEFMATDPVHDRLKQFDYEIGAKANAVDLFSGQGTEADQPILFSDLFTADMIGELNHIHGFYTFLSGSGQRMQAVLTATDFQDEVIRQRKISAIKPEQNKIIRYKGRLYSRSESDDTFQISIFDNGAWSEIIEEELND